MCQSYEDEQKTALFGSQDVDNPVKTVMQESSYQPTIFAIWQTRLNM